MSLLMVLKDRGGDRLRSWKAAVVHVALRRRERACIREGRRLEARSHVEIRRIVRGRAVVPTIGLPGRRGHVPRTVVVLRRGVDIDGRPSLLSPLVENVLTGILPLRTRELEGILAVMSVVGCGRSGMGVADAGSLCRGREGPLDGDCGPRSLVVVADLCPMLKGRSLRDQSATGPVVLKEEILCSDLGVRA